MGLMLIPMDLLSSLGFSSAAVVFTTMIINATLIPTLLLWNPCKFFTNAASVGSCFAPCLEPCKRFGKTRRTATARAVALADNDGSVR
jgi:hypothetical protein